MTTEETERELERLAKVLGGGWTLKTIPGVPIPIPELHLTMMEAQHLEKRLCDD